MTLVVVVLCACLIVAVASVARRMFADDARRTIQQANSARAAMRRAREQSVHQHRRLTGEDYRDSRSA